METLALSEVLVFATSSSTGPGEGLSRPDGNDAFAPVAIGSRELDLLGLLIAMPRCFFTSTQRRQCGPDDKRSHSIGLAERSVSRD